MGRAAGALLTILDLGTGRIRALAVRLQGGQMRYAGHVTTESRGLRKGQIVSLEAAGEAIQQAARALEEQVGEPVERVFLTLTGAQVKGLSCQAAVSLTSRSREVTWSDTRRVLELARTLSLPEDREIVHVASQEFVLDHQGGIQEPVGMLASRLEARVYIITVNSAAKNNLVLAANRAGIEVLEVVFAPLAVAEACLRAEERQAGVAVLELGAGSTGLLAYNGGGMVHAASLPVGGDHFTNDIALALHTPPAEAERIKCGFGFATTAYALPQGEVEVPNPGAPPRLVPHRELCECIEPRTHELVRLLARELPKAGPLGAGVLLSGGGAKLAGLSEVMRSSFGRPVRTAEPLLLEGMPDELAEPEYCCAVGACYYAHRRLHYHEPAPGLWERLRQMVDERFS